MLRWNLVVALVLAPACTVERDEPDTGRDAPAASDIGGDVPPMSCTSMADCDDGIPCTFDDCIVGNVCEHMPLDTSCGPGEHCDLRLGCTSGCETAADCNVDRNYCDGMYACAAGTCIPGTPRNCNDGNECTTDTCDPSAMGGLGGCVYGTATGCDGGVGMTDGGGPVCDPFDPETGYVGTFDLLPPQTLGCSSASYTLNTVTFAIAGTTLTATGAPSFRTTMSGAVPTGESFSVTGTDSYGTYTLTGTFLCANRFTATYSFAPVAAWTVCGTHSTTVSGRR